MALTVRRAARFAGVDRAAWDRLDHGPSPFLKAGFLAALEASGSIGPGTGWVPHYLLCEAGGELVGAVAAFTKRDSYGEFIFDWEWANAAARTGIRYYPKLVVAAPVTPATGPRLLIHPDAARAEVVAALVAAVRELADAERCSSIHWLFCTAAEEAELVGHGFAARASFQFHWASHGYARFDDFLAELTSRKRKQLRKERERARAAVDEVAMVPACELPAADLDAMDRFYRDNVDAHGGTAYLEPGFFALLARELPDTLFLARARRGGRTVAGAIFLEGPGALYGRYWGASEPIPLLHFELSYYLGIEHAIARGLGRFEAGAQGGHKLLRGFDPAPTHSCHWLRHPGLDQAVRGFLVEEARAVAAHMVRLAEHGPFKET